MKMGICMWLRTRLRLRMTVHNKAVCLGKNSDTAHQHDWGMMMQMRTRNSLILINKLAKLGNAIAISKSETINH